ncbi:MAG: DUF2029 domain-containing protein [Actinobacteria bacterium]|nr:DUF2029 domain-containing protein [Actinomycetota bacterium]
MVRPRRLADAGAEARNQLKSPAVWAGAFALAGTCVAVAAFRATGYVAASPIHAPGGWRPALNSSLAAAFLAYAVGLVLLARRPAKAAPVLALAVTIQFVPLFTPLLLSRDPLVYVAWGRMSHPFDPPGAWPPVETYGPLWQVVAIPLSHFGHHAYAFRLLAAACVLAIMWLVWRLATRKVLAAAIVGWNPFVALHYAGGGHNDALMMALVLGVLLAFAVGRPQLGGAGWAVSIFVKWSAGWFFVLWAIDRFRKRRPLGIAGLVVCGVIVLALSFALYGATWLHAFSSLSEQERLDHPSLGLLGWFEDAGLARRPALVVVALMQLATLAVFAWTAWRGRLRLGLAAVFLVVCAPRLDPWYALWPLALSAADDEDRWGRVLAVALTGFLLTDAFSHFIEA